jgi:hypothetical protein
MDVLRQGDQVKVLAPADLALRVQQRLRLAAGRYDEADG